MQLNEEQQKAVHHVDGPMLVLAGAGSGKTRVVSHRISALIDMGVMPSSIVAVTFTNKAADEMRKRVFSLTKTHVLTSTFHSLGARILRESISVLGYQKHFTIYDEEDSEKLIKTCLKSLNQKEEKGLVKKLKGFISSAKNDLLSPDDESLSHETEYQKVYACYQARLKECNALDFDDLLYLTVKLLQENPVIQKEYQERWLFLLIDEYQDTNFAQYQLAKILSGLHNNIFAVGDPDQSIYSWRGARYQNILNFSDDFTNAKIIKLEQNYRSTETILEASNALIQHNQNRYEKKLWSALGKGESIKVYYAQNEKLEAHFIMQKIQDALLSNVSMEEIVIFYRTNAQSRVFEDALLSKRLPYEIIGGISFYQRREIKDILAFLRLVMSGADLISFARVVNVPKKGLGQTTVQKLTDLSTKESMPILELISQILHDPSKFPIRLSTKQQKALREFLHVIHELRQKIHQEKRISDMINDCIDLTRYEEHLKENPESFEDRLENLDALESKAAEWEEETENPTLHGFLEELSLKAHKDTDEKASIKLMTLHNGKGLEFDCVFIAGLEEDLLPHINSKDQLESIEEERRLMYVGMTRAKKHLFLTASHFRYLWGTPKMMTPSRFLKEVPSHYLENLSPKEYQEEVTSHQDNLLSPGCHVKHPHFGLGVIQKTYQTSYGPTYDVYFEEIEMTRSLVAKYAKLEMA